MDLDFGPLWKSANGWHEAKLFIEHAVSICHDTLHLFAGLLIWLVAALLAKRPLTAWVPLFVTLFFAVLNEAIDLSVELWPSPGMQFGEGARDVMTTMAVPTLMFVAFRAFPRLSRAGRK